MRRLIVIAIAALSACGTGEGAAPDAAVDAEEPEGPLDLARAQWIHSPVYVDSATISTSADLAITDSGELIAAWAEDVGSGSIETAVFVGEGGPEFATRSVIATPGTSVTRPSIYAGVSDIHLVGASNAGTTRSDIFYARRAGGTWSGQTNVTAPGDGLNLVDHDPEVLEIGSEVVVLFRSHVFNMVTLENDGIYMLRFTDPQNPGVAVPVLDRATFDCNDFEALADDSGAIHLVANCTEDDGDREIFYVTNKSGSFVSREIPNSVATSPLSPDIAISDGGNSVHLLWNASTDCGGITCRDLFYSKDLAPPFSVSGGEEDGGFIPHIAVDDLGRVIVAFHRLGDVDDVMWSYSETSTAFVRVQLATPGTPDSVDSSVGNLVIDPTTNRPHMVYVHSLPGAGRTLIFRGELVR